MISAAQGIDSVQRAQAIEIKARQSTNVTDGFRSVARIHPLVPWNCLLTVWGIAVAAGTLFLGAYAAAPGAAGQALPDWPRDSVIPLDGRRPTLVMFLHPLCPCSRASVDELTEILGRCRNHVRAHAVILRTPSLEGARGPRIDRQLQDVQGLRAWYDDGASLSRRFGVLTSGHVLIYDPSGRLLYSGGITPARGHRGENFGRSAVLAALRGERTERTGVPPFGCPLFEVQPAGTTEPRP